VSPKRQRRRDKREAVLGPERPIVSTACGAHLLSCGHQVPVLSNENPHIKRRRCVSCLRAIEREADLDWEQTFGEKVDPRALRGLTFEEAVPLVRRFGDRLSEWREDESGGAEEVEFGRKSEES
jgi:hypothetical protein